MTTTTVTEDIDITSPWTTQPNLVCDGALCHNFPIVRKFPAGDENNATDLCVVHYYSDSVSGGMYQWLTPNDNGIMVVTGHKFLYISIHDSVLRMATSQAIKAVKNFKEAAQAKTDKWTAIAEYEQKVVEAVIEYPAGCRSGKSDFLDTLGLSYPSTSVTMTVTFEYNGDPDDLYTPSIQQSIRDYVLDGEADDVDVTLDF